MTATLAADRLEYVLAELQEAIANIEGAKPEGAADHEKLNAHLLEALKKAHAILDQAQGVAEQQGVRKLGIF